VFVVRLSLEPLRSAFPAAATADPRSARGDVFVKDRSSRATYFPFRQYLRQSCCAHIRPARHGIGQQKPVVLSRRSTVQTNGAQSG
jgi:hypothetical protein